MRLRHDSGNKILGWVSSMLITTQGVLHSQSRERWAASDLLTMVVEGITRDKYENFINRELVGRGTGEQ